MAYLEPAIVDPALPASAPAWGTGEGRQGAPEPRTPLGELLATLRRRWRVIAAFTGGMTALMVVAILFATPRYTATAVLHVKLTPPHATNIQQVVTPPSYLEGIEYFQDQVKLLESRSLSARVIRELGLDHDDRFTGPANGPGFVESLLYRIGGLLGALRERMRGADPAGSGSTRRGGGDGPEIVYDVPSAMIGRYARWLEVKPVTNSRLVQVSFTSPSATVAQRVANAHARGYIRQTLESKFALTGEARKFLEAEIDRVQQELAYAEQALNDFRRRNHVVSLDDRENAIVDRLTDLGRRLTEAEAQRITTEADHRMIAERDVESLPSILQSPVIQALKQEVTRLEIQAAQLEETFLPGTPQVREMRAQLASARSRLKREADRAVAGVESAYLAAKAREDSLRQQFEAQQAAVLGLKEISGEYVKLDQAVNTTRQLYGTLIQRLQETDVVKGDTLSSASVLDAAERPTSPSQPDVLFDLAFGLIFGLGLGVAVALVLEHVDPSFKTPDEVRRQLRLPTLGVVPDFARLPTGLRALPSARLLGRLAGRRPVALPLERSPSAEAYRSIRTSILFFNPQQPPRSLLVTSSQPQEGKTSTTVNLALSLAQLQRSVVVVDADMRQARCHRALGLPPAAGLSEVLRGLARLPHVVQRLTVQGGRVVRAESGDGGGPELHLLQAGRAPADPAALLASPRMDEVLQALLQSYDIVLIDSPPVFPITDSAILAAKVDGVVFVVRGGRTERQVTREALERLRYMQANVMGVVLNGVDPGSSHYHSYAYYFAA